MLRRCVFASVAACSFRPGVIASGPADATVDVPIDATPTTAALFVPDFTAGKLSRFAISIAPTPPPAPLELLLAGAESPIMRKATGELLVGEYVLATIVRYATPLAQPVPTSTITGAGLSTNFGKMIFVDSELWLVNDGLISDIDRVAFTPQGTAMMTGVVTVAAPRGLVFDPGTRDLYVTQCCGTDTILHFQVAADHSVISKPSLSGNGLNNPHGMWIAPWGELFVANAGGPSVLRFTRDAAGTLTANGEIIGNGLALPIDLVMAPWGELYVSNQGNSTISRFRFDAAHAAAANGMFAVPSAGQIGWISLQ